MHYHAERNERRSRRNALVLAIALHLGLAAALYLTTTDDAGAQTGKAQTVQTEKPVAKPGARAVKRP